MNFRIFKRDVKMRQFLKISLITQLLVCCVIVFNIPIVRQIVTFIYLIFMPGMILLKIIKLQEVDTGEFLLFSLGLSIFFIMFIGLFINNLYRIKILLKPLSTVNLLIVFNIVLFGLSFISNFIDRDKYFLNLNYFKFNIFEIKFESYIRIFLLFLFPIISIIGAYFVKNNFGNYISLALIIFISLLIILSVINKKILPSEYYGIGILIIAISLLFHESLTSFNLYGYDINLEYYIFKLTKDNYFWNNIITSLPSSTSNYNSMLSITILPTVFSNLLNLNEIWVLKILYPIIFSFVPYGLYKIYSKQMTNKTAFLSIFFFMSFYVFYRAMLGLAKQMIAELFFILLILLLFDKKIDSSKKKYLYVFFSTGLVFSHYSISYIYIFLIIIAWLISIIFKIKISLTKYELIFFCVIAFSWYIFTSGSSPFLSLLKVGSRILSSFATFFSRAAREREVLIAIGMGEPAPSLGHLIGRFIHYLTQFFILVGFFSMLRKQKVSKYEKEYILISCASMVLILLGVLLPRFSSTLRVTRIYHLSLFFLAPLCITGGETFFKYVFFKLGKISINTQITKTLISIVLIFYFLTDIGFIYEITGDVPFSNALSRNRTDPVMFYNMYISDYEKFSAKWLALTSDSSRTIYADLIAKEHVLTSYGMFPRNNMQILHNNTKKISEGAYIYLRGVNNIHGKIVHRYIEWNISEVTQLLVNNNIIYSNGESTINHNRINVSK